MSADSRHRPAGSPGRRGPAQPVAGWALLAAALGLAACSGAKTGAAGKASPAVKVLPERIIAAPRSLLAASGPATSGTMWAVAGSSSVGLYRFNSASGKQTGSLSVTNSARSVAETSSGMLAVALGTSRSGALDLLRAHAGKAWKTVSLPAPAVQVVAAGTDFYALSAWPSSASVTVVSAGTGKIAGAVPAPKDSVSLTADPQHGLIYVLQRNGLVDDISLHGGSIQSSFSVGDPGESIAVSPDGTRLYVLKGTTTVSNIAVVNTATGGILKVLPAPSHCVQLIVSPTGHQLYEVVGSPAYGNIQVVGF